jgi:uncharacterized membrane protein
MVEAQSAHRIQLESMVVASQQRQGERGQNYGLLIGIFGISVGAALSFFGHEAVGGVIAGTTVTGLVTAFLIGKSQQNSDLTAKKPSRPI